MLLNILAVGDVVGEGGLDILSRRLDGLRQETEANFVVVNGENASGVGITPAQARRILEAGADVITLGNHTWNRLQIGDYLDKEERILRPANYAGRVPGRGMGIYPCKGLRIAVLNLMGRAELNSNLDNPFKMANTLLRGGDFDLALLDFHAEATSEKGAMARYPVLWRVSTSNNFRNTFPNCRNSTFQLILTSLTLPWILRTWNRICGGSWSVSFTKITTAIRDSSFCMARTQWRTLRQHSASCWKDWTNLLF